MTADLIEFAAVQQRCFDTLTSADERKNRGHFGTPPVIAQAMAAMLGAFEKSRKKPVRVLDAGAGVGTLSAAICQRILQQKSAFRLSFELWENDPKLIPLLERTMANCQKSLEADGHTMEFIIRPADFILENTQKDLFQCGPEPSFDVAILNPPYFKLRKDSVHAQAMTHVIHGQPNIYALFMAVAADLLLPGGELVAITPRSYFNGPYFKRFRKWFFDRLAARQIHIFESRTDAFKDDEVLQENVILKAQKGGETSDVILSTSKGRDFAQVERSLIPYDRIIDNGNGDYIVRVATSSIENEIVERIDSLTNRFRSIGYAISTGPVVTFRATEFLRNERGSDTAPLLWMHNVRPFVTQFPPKNGKPLHIEVSNESKRLLVPAKNYVLLKRFTAKEEKRRLVAGIVTEADCYSEWVGLENHLNYVYRSGSELSPDEAFGLAAYFNSSIVDRYFRAISGNTQVNATEIRGMPVPDIDSLIQIGERIQRFEPKDLVTVEKVVGDVLGIPCALVDQLIGVAA